MVDQTEGQRGNTQPQRQSRGEREARTVKTVCTASSLSYRLGLIVCRSLEDIEKRSSELAGKGKVARILDKTQDAGTIVKLVEELRQAILIYQVGCCDRCWA